MKNAVDNHEPSPEDDSLWPDEALIQQEVQEVTSGMREVADESTLNEKVGTLILSLEDISQEVHAWRGKNYYLDAIEGLKQQVDSIKDEWTTLSEGMQTQRERLESLLQAFPGIIETSTLRALSMRMHRLEEVVKDIVEEREAKVSKASASKQIVISIVALAVSILSCSFFILFRLFPP